ncbi:KH domain-containing protein [Trichocoleus sp. FACHB-262]|nr:KH domain-containing protein [Trichocoleus sp. FACHB-262]
MSSNRSMPESSSREGLGHSTPPRSANPNYVELVRFLIQPFLESPESLKVDCELSASRPKIWIRLAFDSSDKGRVFGRGGRNIQAIRTVLEAAAQSSGQAIYLDVFGGDPVGNRDEAAEPESSSKSQPPRSAPPKSAPKLRTQ